MIEYIDTIIIIISCLITGLFSYKAGIAKGEFNEALNDLEFYKKYTKMIKNFTAFSIDAETMQLIHNFKIINETIPLKGDYIIQYESLSDLKHAMDEKFFDYVLERVEIDFRHEDIMYYIRQKDSFDLWGRTC